MRDTAPSDQATTGLAATSAGNNAAKRTEALRRLDGALNIRILEHAPTDDDSSVAEFP